LVRHTGFKKPYVHQKGKVSYVIQEITAYRNKWQYRTDKIDTYRIINFQGEE